jgi:hypothetical protein
MNEYTRSTESNKFVSPKMSLAVRGRFIFYAYSAENTIKTSPGGELTYQRIGWARLI